MTTAVDVRGSELTGTRHLIRIALRLDRWRTLIWAVAVAGLTQVSISSLSQVYSTPEALAGRAQLISSPAATALAGPGYGLDNYTVGAMTANELGLWIMIPVAIMALLTVTRHLRAEEEDGRLELVRSGPVGRDAPVVAGLVAAVVATVAVGGLTFLALLSTDLDPVGSLALCGGIVMVGLVFAGVSAVASQLTAHARAATSLGMAVLGVAFLLRAVGDINGSALIWASPIGWAQAVHPFSDNRWWPLLLCVAAAGALLTVAVGLLDHRDLGAGLVSGRPGAPAAGSLLASPLGLAVRLQRAALLAWAFSLVVLGAVYGSMGDAVESLFKDNPAAQAFLPGASAAGLIEGYLATIFSIDALLAAAFAVSSVLRAHAEESAGRVEPVLATATSRSAWLRSHVTVAFLGSALLVVGSGAATALVRAASSGDSGSFGRLFGASLAYVPAVWALAGVAVAAVGLVPRAAAAVAWAMIGYAVVVAVFAPGLNWPDWLGDLSPFAWTPLVPVESWTLPAAAGLAVAVAALLAVGFGAFGRRDLSTG